MLKPQWQAALAAMLAFTALGSAAQMSWPSDPPALPPGAVWVVPQTQVYVTPVYPLQGGYVTPSYPFQGQIAVPSEGYPPNRNLNLDNRAPAVWPVNPPTRQAAPRTDGQFGHAQPGWGSMQPQWAPGGEASREEGWGRRRN
jgi:hypothetical protein